MLASMLEKTSRASCIVSSRFLRFSMTYQVLGPCYPCFRVLLPHASCYVGAEIQTKVPQATFAHCWLKCYWLLWVLLMVWNEVTRWKWWNRVCVVNVTDTATHLTGRCGSCRWCSFATRRNVRWARMKFCWASQTTLTNDTQPWTVSHQTFSIITSFLSWTTDPYAA